MENLYKEQKKLIDYCVFTHLGKPTFVRTPVNRGGKKKKTKLKTKVMVSPISTVLREDSNVCKQ